MTTNETKTRPPLWSHLLVAAATVAAVLVVQRWLASPPTADQPTAQPTTTADVSANSATPDASSEVTEVAPAAAVTATKTERAPLRIVFSPTSLRVWHNTRMRFHVTPAEDRSFVQYTWHFEDGSAPANGEEVEHTFPESVTDRFISVEAVDGDGKTVVVSKRLPIERLEVAPVDGQAPSVRSLPKPRGPRILFARDLNKGVEMANFASQLRQWRVALLILSTSPEVAQRTAQELLKQGWRGATLTWSARIQSAEDETAPPSALGPPLNLVADPDNTLRHQPKSLIWTLGEAALVAHDSRRLVTSEEDLQEFTGALTTASAYPNALLLTAGR